MFKIIYLALILNITTAFAASKMMEMMELSMESKTQFMGMENSMEASMSLEMMIMMKMEVSQKHKDFMCKVKKLAEKKNIQVLEDRAFVLDILESLSKKEEVAFDDEVKFLRILMDWRLIGKDNFFYSYTLNSSASIAKNLTIQATKMAKENKLEKINCFYLRNLVAGKEWEAKANIKSDACLSQIKKRINAIPVPLAVIQAVEESGWGTNGYTRKGNNIFSIQFKYGDNKSFPINRKCMINGKHNTRCVFKFDSYSDAVDEYFRLLNAGSLIYDFRETRGEEELKGDDLYSCAKSKSLVEGLGRYAENAVYFKHLRLLHGLLCEEYLQKDNCSEDKKKTIITVE